MHANKRTECAAEMRMLYVWLSYERSDILKWPRKFCECTQEFEDVGRLKTTRDRAWILGKITRARTGSKLTVVTTAERNYYISH